MIYKFDEPKASGYMCAKTEFYGVQNTLKCVSGRGFAQDLAGELTTLPKPPSPLGRGYPTPLRSLTVDSAKKSQAYTDILRTADDRMKLTSSEKDIVVKNESRIKFENNEFS